MSNIWHLTHQTPKKSLMRCSKCRNIWHWWTIYSQIWKHIDRNCIILMSFLFPFLSYLSSLSVRSLPLSFFSNHEPLFSQPLIFSSLTLTALPLSLTKPTHHYSSSTSLFFFFFFFCCDLMGGLGRWYVGSNGVGWVRFRRWWVGSDGQIDDGWVRL